MKAKDWDKQENLLQTSAPYTRQNLQGAHKTYQENTQGENKRWKISANIREIFTYYLLLRAVVAALIFHVHPLTIQLGYTMHFEAYSVYLLVLYMNCKVQKYIVHNFHERSFYG